MLTLMLPYWPYQQDGDIASNMLFANRTQGRVPVCTLLIVAVSSLIKRAGTRGSPMVALGKRSNTEKGRDEQRVDLSAKENQRPSSAPMPRASK